MHWTPAWSGICGRRYSPQIAALAKQDRGTDPKRFEAAPSLADFDRRDALAKLYEKLLTLTVAVRDTMFELGSAPRETAIAVYGLAKVIYDSPAARRTSRRRSRPPSTTTRGW